MRHFRSTAVTSVLLLGGLLTTVAPVLASTVTYTTTGVFSASGGATYNGTGASSVVFSPGSANVTAPSAGNLGMFTSTVPTGTSITGSGNFTLTINQTSPNAGSNNFGSDTFSGKLSKSILPFTTGDLVITFANTSVNIGGVTYTLEGLGGAGFASNQLVIGNGVTTIQADETTPEPTFYSVLGVGLIAILVLKRKQGKSTSIIFNGGDQIQ